jgi:hypothetical protein
MRTEAFAILNSQVGIKLVVLGIVLGWIGTYFNHRMIIDVKRLAPSKATGLRNLFETTSRRRVWREHKRLFSKSRVRTRATFFLTLSAVTVLAGFVLAFVGW